MTGHHVLYIMHMSNIAKALEGSPRRGVSRDVYMIMIMGVVGAKFKPHLTCVKGLGRTLSNLQTQVRL